MGNILEKLKGGDRRSIGKVDEVVEAVSDRPELFDDLFQGMLSSDPIIRMRSADAVEKITVQHPEYLQVYKKKLIEDVAKIEQQEIRWHVAQMFPRLITSKEEVEAIVEILLNYLRDKSKIVKTFSMEALATFAENDSALRPRVYGLLEKLVKTGSPAMKSRGRKLLERLNRET
jgi:hypothetical protein